MASGILIKRKKQEGDQEIVLRLLEHVTEDDRLSQAKFADQIGIAKGLANAYFNRCLQKGWIKLRQVPRRRYLYYLTPKGFAEKARLTAQFLTYSYQFYRNARTDLLASMGEAKAGGHSRLVVLGAGELAEIAAIVSGEASIEITSFVMTNGARDCIGGIPVTGSWSQLVGGEPALLAAVEDARELYQEFRRRQPKLPVYVPKLLSGLVWE